MPNHLKLGSFMLLALVIIALMYPGAAGAAPIYRDQVQNINFSGHPDPLIHNEDGTWSGIPPGYPYYSQSALLTFQGPPTTSFMLEGHSYFLKGASVILSSNFYAKYGVGAYDSDWMSDASVSGSVSTWINATIRPPIYSTLADVVFPSGELAASVTDNWLLPIAWLLGEEWGNFGQADVGKQIEVNKSINATALLDLNLVLQNKEIYVSLVKVVSYDLFNFSFNADDDWDAIANPVNVWQGTLTLRYIYEERPVPPPAILYLLDLSND